MEVKVVKVTNKEFASKDKSFRYCCEAAGVEPTKRQASKFRMKKGKAWNNGRVR